MITLIDADAVIYIQAWKFKEQDPEFATKMVLQHTDTFIRDILATTKATHYLGAFSDEKNFRHRIYKYAPYKGQRKEKEQWMLTWGPILKQHLMDKWGFVLAKDLEADDVVCAAHEMLSKDDECIVCSPDKDLRQIAGIHYDYKCPDKGIVVVSPEQAALNFWTQMLTGDTVDAVCGLSGVGPVKCKEMFAKGNGKPYLEIVMEAYLRHHGDHYGRIIFQQTFDTLQLMCSHHRLWDEWLYAGDNFEQLLTDTDGIIEKGLKPVPQAATEQEVLDSTLISQFGWDKLNS